ncbi:sodium/potassium-transporting ATPase subunit beta-1-interacting protein [Aphomia sociella]
MAVCGLRTLLLIVCVLELVVTIQRQIFDFLGYMWLPIIANFVNILLIIFGSFGAVQYITNYIIAYAIWSFMWLTWNLFLICYYLNLGTLNRESGLLSLGTESVSWWESNGWGCQPVWDGEEKPGTWRPARVDGCFLQWYHVELGQSILGALLTTIALPLALVLAFKSLNKRKPASEKGTLQRRTVYTMELSPTETTASEGSLKPMTPRRVKRRSGSRGTGSSVRRSRRSYRNAGYLASSASLPRDGRPSRPTSAHSSYSNFHGARPASYHAPEREATSRAQDSYDPPQPPSESVPIKTNRYDTVRRVNKSSGYDVVGPYNEPNRGYDPSTNYDRDISPYDNMSRGYETALNYENRMEAVAQCESPSYGAVLGYPSADSAWDVPPPAPPVPQYCSRATPQAPGPPAYQPTNDAYLVP